LDSVNELAWTTTLTLLKTTWLRSDYAAQRTLQGSVCCPLDEANLMLATHATAYMVALMMCGLHSGKISASRSAGAIPVLH